MSSKLISDQNQLISSEQLQFLLQLRQFETVLDTRSLTQINLGASVQFQQTYKQKLEDQKHNKVNHKNHSEIDGIISPQKLKKHQSSFKSHNSLINQHPVSSDPLFLLNKQLQSSGPQEYNLLKDKLLRYKQKSNQIYKVGQFIKSYEQNFIQLVKQKEQLVNMLKQIKGQTSHLVQRQKSLIDLSMALKESLDYYTYHEKNNFNYPCEISCRQLFEESLQPTLSTIMDGIEFFTENQAYVASKKHLNQYMSSKSKLLSFIKSFYIKLFNKENNFVMKYIQMNKIFGQLNSLYPKSRIVLLMHFLMTFPQMKKYLKTILSSVKDNKQEDQKKQQDTSFIQLREHQITQFLLSDHNLSLIRYLEKNNYEIYSQVMLNLWTFNRFNFHQNLVFIWMRKISSQSSIVSKQAEQLRFIKQKLQSFRQKIHFAIQVTIVEYLYFFLCCRPSNSQSIEFFTSWIYKLVFKYLQVLVKQSRDLVIKYKFNPFELCQKIENIVDIQIKSYFSSIQKQQYQSYVIDCLWLQLVGRSSHNNVYSSLSLQKPDIKSQQQNQHTKLLKQVFNNTIKGKLLNQLGQYCFQHLPKISPTQSLPQIENSINQLLYFIPKLHYCSNQSETYMISSLDTLIKSIKQFNQSIESRYECYAWNLVAFGGLRTVLKIRQMRVVSKQIRLDFNQSLNIIERVKRLERPQSLIQYAQDIFNVIKTGMPSLNQLTMDFNKYISEHYEELETRFLKDILFIYAKNMIEFLQRIMLAKKHSTQQKERQKQKQIKNQKDLEQHPQQKLQFKNQKKNIDQLHKLCDPILVKSLYNSYILSIQKYIKQSCQILQTLSQSKIQNKLGQINNLKGLIKQVYQKLFDFLDTFYINLTEINSEITKQFQQIDKIKEKQEVLWSTNQNNISTEKIQQQTS